MIRLQSVKVRLTLWYALVLSVFLAIFSFIMYAELSRALYHDAEKNLSWSALQAEEALKANLISDHALVAALNRSAHDRMKPFDSGTGEKIISRVKAWENQSQILSRSLQMIRLTGLDQQVIVSNLEGWEKGIIFPNFERDSNFMENGTSYQTIHFQNKPFRLYYRLLRIDHHPVLQ